MTNSKKIGSIISYIVILLVIIAVIGVFAYFTNGFQSDFKTFYVNVNGKDVMTSKGGFLATSSKPLKVDVKYTFGALNKEESKDYSVKIVPNKIEGKDFYFTVDGEEKNFQSETDMTSGFIIEKNEKSFTVKPVSNELLGVLSAVYGKEITDCESKGYEDMFTLIVTSYNNEAQVTLQFSLPSKVAEIILSEEVIEF